VQNDEEKQSSMLGANLKGEHNDNRLERRRKLFKRLELTIMNSSENDISDHKFTIIPPRKRFEDKHTLLY
jgi:hypothetical protein